MDQITYRDKANAIISDLNKAFEKRDIDAIVSLFQDDCYWRDLLAFTWNIKTLSGSKQIREMLISQLNDVNASNWSLIESEEVTEENGIVTAWFNFDTENAHGCGLMRLIEGEIWTLLTTMVELTGHEERVGFHRPNGIDYGVEKNRQTWGELHETEKSQLGYKTQPYTVIVGGGQGGIMLGARLRALGVPTIIVDKNERPGDSWRNRYKSLCLHDPVWYDHFPYLPFPPSWPVFSPKDKIGDWLEMYTNIMELNYWSNTTCESAYFDESSKEWMIKVNQKGKDITLQPKHLILATGMSGKPNIPNIPGMDRFQGEQHHSSRHAGPDAYKGKKAIVIGSNNSAHDICAALWENDVDVTMVQRSSTTVVRSDTLMSIGLEPLYSEKAVKNGMNHDKADLLSASIPYSILHEFKIPETQAMKNKDIKFYDELSKSGFLLDWGDDDSGLTMKYLRRGSGYYIDVGASQLIIDGKIKLKQGQVSEVMETGVKLNDGAYLSADLIVYATGYISMNSWAAELIHQDVADKVGKVWGLGSNTEKDPGPWEGELRNMWKPTQQENLWFHGGNLHQSRHYSQFLSLQLKARMEGIPTPVYGLQEVYHNN